MKIVYSTVGLILLSGIVFSLSCTNNSQPNVQVTKQKGDKMRSEEIKSDNNPYEDLRNMALATTPEQLDLILPNNETKVYGVIMDWNLGEGVATLITFETGDASFYLSSGSGTIGGGFHENVKKAATNFTDKAQTYLSKATKTETTPLPEENSVKFYFLTNKGKFVAREKIENFENNSSEWLKLFEEANKVITELRLTTERN